MGRRRAVELSVENVEFVDVPARKKVAVSVQVEGDGTAAWNGNGNLTGAVVKPKLTYPRGMEARAHEVAGEVVNELATAFGATVLRAELVATGSARTRMPEVKKEADPVDAVAAWMKERPPKAGVDAGEVKRYVEEVIRSVEQSGMDAGPADFVVRSVLVENFMPFWGRQEVMKIGPGVYGVIGRYGGEGGRSNRSGKSAFLEAVLYAMFGDGRSVRTVDQYVHHGEVAMRTAVGIDTRSGVLQVERVYKKTGTVVTIDGEKFKVDDAKERVEKLIGMTKKDFVRTCFVLQGDLHGLLKENSAQMKEEVSRWLGLQLWRDVEDRVAAKLGRIQERLKKNEARAELLMERVAAVDVTEVGVQELRGELSGAEREMEEAAGVDGAVQQARRKVEDAKEYYRAKAVVAEGEAAASSAKRLGTKYSKLQAKADKVKAARDAVERSIREYRGYMSGFDGACPIDGAQCPRKDELNSNDAVYEEKIAELEKTAPPRAEYDALKNDLEVVDAERMKVAGVAQRAKEAAHTVERLGAVEGVDVDDLEDELHQLEAERPNLQAIRSRVTRLRDDLTEAVAKLKTKRDALEAVEEMAGDTSELKRERGVAAYARVIVGKAGIPSMMIENALTTVEGHVNMVLEMVGTEQRIEFSHEVELKRKETVCGSCGHEYDGQRGNECPVCGAERGKDRADQFSVKVVDRGIAQTFDQDSGGGKALVALAVRIALAKLLGAKVLFLDEVCGTLDDENLRLMVEMIRKLPEMGFEQVFVISHRKEVAEALPRNIVVTRDAATGRSEVAWDA